MKKNTIHKLLSKIAIQIEPYDKWGIINKIRQNKINTRILPENEKIENAVQIILEWPENVEKPFVGLVKSEIGSNSYWPKFKRFLDLNNIPYEFIDIKSSSFISEAIKYDIIVWRTPSNYADQWEAEDKVVFIQDYLGKMILPPKQALWIYENKIREQWLLELNNLPVINTFISYSKEEVKEFIETGKYPLLLKDKTSSSSEGVKLIKNKRKAKKIWRRIFFEGLKLDNTYVKQKDYVILQEFVPNKGFDLRVIIVGNSYFGYYRYPKKRDFRASGSGIVDKREIPFEVLQLAKRVKQCFPKTYLLAVDFLKDSRDSKYYIIETSIFISIETCEQLVVNGIPGRYIEKDGNFVFEPGRFWLQELMMEELMKDWISVKEKEI